MRDRVRGRRDGEAEAVVRERLRSIVAAAAPRAGWVPERVGEEAAGRSQDDALAGVRQPAEPQEPGTEQSEAPPGRHRGDPGAAPGPRWDPGRPGALALCLVAIMAALLAAGITWWSRPSSSAADQVGAGPLSVAGGTSAPEVGRGGTAGQAGSTPGTAGPDSSAELVVSVIGQVRRPGLVTVVHGARVADAIAAAGGALPEADLSTVNLARLVVDGEQIAVGIPGSSLPGAGDPLGSGGLVNLNTATQAELEELPGIGPVLAQRIIDFRETNGGFDAVEQLREVSGIGPTVYEDIVDLVTV